MAFTLSLDDFVISYFTTGSGFETLPIRIYSMTKKRVTPDMYALSTLIFIAVLAAAHPLPILPRSRGGEKRSRAKAPSTYGGNQVKRYIFAVCSSRMLCALCASAFACRLLAARPRSSTSTTGANTFRTAARARSMSMPNLRSGMPRPTARRSRSSTRPMRPTKTCTPSSRAARRATM